MKTIVSFMSLIFNCLLLLSQERGIVIGRVLDSLNQFPLEHATIEAFKISDNSNVYTAVSNSNGWFRLLNIPIKDTIVIQISYTGYERFRGILVLEEKHLEMTAVFLNIASKQMDTVSVLAKAPLFSIKKDTIEFNAAVFRMLPNAVAQDLLKKIPGLIINEQGQLVFNGSPVSKILVNGKVFFNSDGRVALANIPFDLIKKVQISVDDFSLNTNVPNSENEKTHILNIRLKDGIKYFGNMKTAIGSEKHFDLSGLINRTNETEQISLLTGWNNINKMNLFPGYEQAGTGPSSEGGIARSVISSLNYTKNYKNGTSFRSVYEYTRPIKLIESSLERKQNLTEDFSLLNLTQQQLSNTTTTHQVALNLQKNYLFFNTTIFNSELTKQSHTNTSTTNEKGQLLNKLESNHLSNSKYGQFQASMNFTKSLKKKDRTVQLNIGYGRQWKNNNDRNYAVTKYYIYNNQDSQSVIRQAIEGTNTNTSFRMNIHFTEPITKRIKWKLLNNFQLQENNICKTSWQLDNNGNKNNIDSTYSNSFNSTIFSNNTASSFNYNGELFAYNIGLGLQLNHLHNNDRTYGRRFKTQSINLVPELELRIRKKPEHENLRLNIRALTNNPTKDQLQPVADNTNPLNIRIGNPNLHSSMKYDLEIQYFKLLSLNSGSAFSITLNYSKVSNKIAPFVTYDSLGRQYSSFVNINGIWSTNMTFNINKLYKNGQNEFSFGTSTTFSLTHDRFYLNEVLSAVNINYLLPTLHFRYTREYFIELNVHYDPTYCQVKYESKPSQNLNYWIQNITSSLDFYLFKRLLWKNNLFYNHNGSYPDNFAKRTFLWNVELAWLLFKNRKGEIKFTAFDLLKQNRNLFRITTDNYVETIQVNNLQRYFMIGFYWQFSKLHPTKALL